MPPLPSIDTIEYRSIWSPTRSGTALFIHPRNPVDALVAASAGEERWACEPPRRLVVRPDHRPGAVVPVLSHVVLVPRSPVGHRAGPGARPQGRLLCATF